MCCQAILRGDLVTVARADHGHSHHVHRILKVFQSPDNAATQNKWFSENSAKALSLSSSSSRSSSSLPSWASSTLPPSASSPPGIAIQAALVRISSHSHTWRRKIWERWQFSQKMMMKYVTPMAMTTTIWLIYIIISDSSYVLLRCFEDNAWQHRLLSKSNEMSCVCRCNNKQWKVVLTWYFFSSPLITWELLPAVILISKLIQAVILFSRLFQAVIIFSKLIPPVILI